MPADVQPVITAAFAVSVAGVTSMGALHGMLRSLTFGLSILLFETTLLVAAAAIVGER